MKRPYRGSVSYRESQKTGMRIPLAFSQHSEERGEKCAKRPQRLHTN